MKSYTIDSVCSTLRNLAPPDASDKMQHDFSDAVALIRNGQAYVALNKLVQARCDSALADEDNRPYIAATEEIASWLIYRAKSLVDLANVSECLNLWAKTGKIAQCIKERERSLRAMSA